MELRRYRPLALLLLVLHLAGCYSWQPVTVSPRQLIEEAAPDHIRIFKADGEGMELRNPQVESDSLTARISTRLRTATVRIALGDIDSVEARRLEVWGTVAAVLLSTLGLGFAIGASGMTLDESLEFVCLKNC